MVYVLMWQFVEWFGVSNLYLSQVECGLCKLFVDVLSQIVKVLWVLVEVFYVCVGIFEFSEISQVCDVVIIDMVIIECQKQILFDIYVLFIYQNEVICEECLSDLILIDDQLLVGCFVYWLVGN